MPLPVIAVPGWLHAAESLAPLRDCLETQSGIGPVTVLDGLPDGPPFEDAVLDSALRAHPGCVLVGWSLGALRCLAAALRQPATTRALVLLAPTARFLADANPDYPGTAPVALRAMRRRLRTDPLGCAGDFLRACHAPRNVAPERIARAAAHAAEQGSTATRDAGLVWLEKADFRDRLAGLSLPVWLLHGTEDRIVPIAQGEWLARNLENATHVVFPGVGHVPDAAMWRAAADAVVEAGALSCSNSQYGLRTPVTLRHG